MIEDDPFESKILKRLRIWKEANTMRRIRECEMEWRSNEIKRQLNALQENRLQLWGVVHD